MFSLLLLFNFDKLLNFVCKCQYLAFALCSLSMSPASLSGFGESLQLRGLFQFPSLFQVRRCMGHNAEPMPNLKRHVQFVAFIKSDDLSPCGVSPTVPLVHLSLLKVCLMDTELSLFYIIYFVSLHNLSTLDLSASTEGSWSLMVGYGKPRSLNLYGYVWTGDRERVREIKREGMGGDHHCPDVETSGCVWCGVKVSVWMCLCKIK